MKTKVAILWFMIIVGLLLLNNQFVKADLGTPLPPAFKALVSSVKAKTYNRAQKQVNLSTISANDPAFVENSKYCRGTSSATSIQTSAGKLTCMPGYRYSLKLNNLIYTYSTTASSANLSLITKISGTSYPISYDSYSYPDGKLRSVVVKLAPQKIMLFSPDGKLKIFSSPKTCAKEKNGVFSKISYTHQMCNKVLEQDEHSLNFGRR